MNNIEKMTYKTKVRLLNHLKRKKMFDNKIFFVAIPANAHMPHAGSEKKLRNIVFTVLYVSIRKVWYWYSFKKIN